MKLLLEDIPVRRAFEILTSRKSKWMQWELRLSNDEKISVGRNVKVFVDGVEKIGDKLDGIAVGMSISVRRTPEGQDLHIKSKSRGGDRTIVEINPPLIKNLSEPQIKEFIKSLADVDPTGTKGAYIPYIAAQIAMGRENIVLDPLSQEDAGRLKETLVWFLKNRDKATWKHSKDLNDFESWRVLEQLYVKAGALDMVSNTQASREFWSKWKDGAELVFSITIPNAFKSEFRMFEIVEPEAMVTYGGNTQWCTTTLSEPTSSMQNEPPVFTYPEYHPKAGETRALEKMSRPRGKDQPNVEGYPINAMNYFCQRRQFLVYVKTNIPLDYTYPNGVQSKDANGHRWVPVIQFEEDGRQMMNPNHRTFILESPGYDYALGMWSQSDPNAPLVAINKMRSVSRIKDYKGRPPLIGAEKALQAESAEPTTLPKPGTKPKSPPKQVPSPFKPTKPSQVPAPMADQPEAPVKPSKPGTKPLKPSKPMPFRPKKPKQAPAPMAVIYEGYDEEAVDSVRDFWANIAKNKNHVYSQHPVLSKHGDKLSRDSYGHTSGRYQKVGGAIREPGMPAHARAFGQILRLEAQYKEQLEALAIKATAAVWGISEDQLIAMITPDVDANSTSDFKPDIEDEMEITPETQKQINKRITMNALTQGSGVHNMMTVHYLVDKELNKICPQLLKLYDQLASGSHSLYWWQNFAEQMADLRGMQVGSCQVEYKNNKGDEGDEGDGGDVPVVVAKAINFPILCQELSKGVMQLLSLHGLGDVDERTLKTIYYYADAAADEPWLIQVGPELWRRFLKVYSSIKGMPQLPDVIASLARQDPDTVHQIVSAVLEDPTGAVDLIRDLVGGEDSDAFDAYDSNDIDNEDGMLS